MVELIRIPSGGRPDNIRTSIRVHSWLKNSFQKQVHTVEIDDGMADVERVHAEDTGDLAATLLQCELRQRGDTKFFPRRFERANVEVVDFCRADLFKPTARELCRDSRRPCREPERSNETFVQDGDKRAGINQQTGRLTPN